MTELIDDPLAAVVRYLRSSATLKDLHSTIPEGGVNPVLGPPVFLPNSVGILEPYTGSQELYIFRNTENTGSPFANIEGTGTSSITLEMPSESSIPPRNTSRMYLDVSVYYMCDVTRNFDISAPLRQDARSKCLSLHSAVRRLFNDALWDRQGTGFFLMGPRPDGTDALKVSSVSQSRSLRIDPVPTGDGMVSGSTTFSFEVVL